MLQALLKILGRLLLSLYIACFYLCEKIIHKIKTLFLLIKYVRPSLVLRLLLNQTVTLELESRTIKGTLHDIWYWLFCEERGFKINFSGDDVYFTKDKIRFVFPREAMPIMWEDFEKYKCFNYKDKVVLDVEGFCGETAVLFHSWGARKVIILEPNPKYYDYIKKNTILNGVYADIYMQAM